MILPVAFGKYVLLERISVGGMAEVFIAKSFGHAGFERIAAIKRILPTMAEDDEFLVMFVDEARISAQLNHSNIAQVYELGRHHQSLYIALEYVPGQSLKSVLEHFKERKQLMPIGQAVFIAAKVCEGLEYAHGRRDLQGNPLNIVHRDISPQNVLVSYDGEIKIIDFGIAKASNRAQQTLAGVLKGKFGYMSPEQVLGLPVDRRSDIFAIGAVLFEMLTGQKAFQGESDLSTLELIKNAEVPSPAKLNPSILPQLETIVLKALSRDLEQRYQWAADLAEALMRYLFSGDTVYSAKHLSAFMRNSFSEEVALEASRMEQFAQIRSPIEEPSSEVASLADTRIRERFPESDVTTIYSGNIEDLPSLTSLRNETLTASNKGKGEVFDRTPQPQSIERTELLPSSSGTATPVMPEPGPRIAHAGRSEPTEDRRSQSRYLSASAKRVVLGLIAGVTGVATLLIVREALSTAGKIPVLIEAYPDTADVSINGANAPNGALTSLPAGEYQVVVSAPQHKTQRRRLVVQPDQNAMVLRVKLERLIDELPPANQPLPPAPNGIATQADAENTSDARIKPDPSPRGLTVGDSPGQARKNAPPRPKGQLACSSLPAGAQVWVDGKYSGRTTPIAIGNTLVLTAGRHAIVFRMPDGTKQSASQPVQISENEITKLVNVPLN